jgi:hypothetical protein
LVGAASGNIIKGGVTDAAIHTGIGVVNGASSNLYTEGAALAGTTTGSTTAGPANTTGANTTTLDVMELVAWDNYVMTPGEVAALTANQRSFWGF